MKQITVTFVMGLVALASTASATLTQVGVYSSTTPGFSGLNVKVVGDYAFVAGYGGMDVVNVSNPAVPVRVAHYTPGWSVYDVDAVGHNVYVSGGTGSDPSQLAALTWDGSSLSLQDTYSGGQWPFGRVNVVGDQAFVGGVDGVFTFDVSDPTDIQPTASLDIGSVYDVVSDGYFAYACHGSYFKTLSLATMPTSLSTLDSFGGYPYGYRANAIRGPYAYIGQDTHGIRILDISDPTDIQSVAHWDPDNRSARDVTFIGGTSGELAKSYMYVARDQGGLAVLDIFDNTFSLVGSIGGTSDPTPAQQWSAQGIDVANGYAYVAAGDGLRIIGGDAGEFNLVPEPATFTCLAMGLLGLIGFGRRRKR
jgi:hypothetical protein